VRGSLRFSPSDTDFDQPDVAPHFVYHTSGTGGRPSRVKRSLRFEVEIVAATLLSLHAYRIARPREAYWLAAPVNRMLAAAGARTITRYGSVENVGVAFGCATPGLPDDVHLMSDRYALVERSHPVEHGSPDAQPFMLTGIHRAMPKVHFNTDLGDAARVEQRACGCALGALGLQTHLSDITSFEKLSGEGMTFARTNLQTVLEEILPARLGGSPVDYQLVEEESAMGGTRLVLVIDPNVPNVDAVAARSVFLASVERRGGADRTMINLWRRADTLVVRREHPRATRAGKVLPLHLARGTGARP
jgi:hypothetical protein